MFFACRTTISISILQEGMFSLNETGPTRIVGPGEHWGEGSCYLGGRLPLGEFNFHTRILGEHDVVSASNPSVEHHLTDLIIGKP